jgi:hypothetical protein
VSQVDTSSQNAHDPKTLINKGSGRDLAFSVAQSRNTEKWSGRQDSNSGTRTDNQELARQDSQGASQNPFSALDPDLQTVIAAWDKLPSALKSAVLAIVSSNCEANAYRSKLDR